MNKPSDWPIGFNSRRDKKLAANQTSALLKSVNQNSSLINCVLQAYMRSLLFCCNYKLKAHPKQNLQRPRRGKLEFQSLLNNNR